MNVFYFAHNGVDHGSSAEAAAHSNNLGVIVGVSVLAALAIFVTVKLLSTKTDKGKPDEEV